MQLNLDSDGDYVQELLEMHELNVSDELGFTEPAQPKNQMTIANLWKVSMQLKK